MSASIRNTWLPADESCPEDYRFAFLDGTVPGNTCSHMGASPQSLMQGIFGGARIQARTGRARRSRRSPPIPAEPSPPKKNFLQKIFGGGNKQPNHLSRSRSLRRSNSLWLWQRGAVQRTKAKPAG